MRFVACLLVSYRQAFGHHLLSVEKSQSSLRLLSQELFAFSNPVMAHDSSQENLINYANSSALQLWACKWDQLVGKPSCLTAPVDQRKSRAFVLENALRRGSAVGYSGIRVDRLGRKFLIYNALIWTIWNENGDALGQAASFSNWDFI